jgi:hypothetical protein
VQAAFDLRGFRQPSKNTTVVTVARLVTLELDDRRRW